MKVLSINLGQDTGGQSYRIAKAFERLEPEWDVRSLTTGRNYIDYPTDLPAGTSAQAAYDAADVVHLHNTLLTYQKLDHDQRKPATIHHHGTAYRTRSWYLDAMARGLGIAQMVSTVDLELIHGHPWLPFPFDVDELGRIGEEGSESVDSERIIIAHAPTNRAVKSTSKVIDAVQRLRRRFPAVELDIIEGVPWEECLRRKARATIFVDQLVLGYGNNAVECMAMGIPVVAGTADAAVRQRMIDHIGHLPYVEATPWDLEKRLEALVTSADARVQAGAIGYDYAAKFHDGRRTVEMLKAFWLDAKPSAGSAAIKEAERVALYPPRTGRHMIFTTTKYPALWIKLGGRYFKFAGGKLRVDEADGDLIKDFAASNPHYGIEWEGKADEAQPADETVDATATTEQTADPADPVDAAQVADDPEADADAEPVEKQGLETRQAVYDAALEQGIIEEAIEASDDDGVVSARIEDGQLIQVIEGEAVANVDGELTDPED